VIILQRFPRLLSTLLSWIYRAGVEALRWVEGERKEGGKGTEGKKREAVVT